MNKFILSFCGFLFLNTTIFAQWSTVTTTNNPVCTASGGQTGPMVVSDGSGGAIITWQEDRNGNYDIYAQRIDVFGRVKWAASAVAICTDVSDQYSPKIVSDGNGGAIISWEDGRNGNYDIYAQRINSSGVVQWAVNGIAVCSASANQNTIAMISDGSNGAILTWQDKRSSNSDIYAQRINVNGASLWTLNGVVICAIASKNQFRPAIVSDGNNGAIITWEDNRNATTDIYVQKISNTGIAQWTTNGVAICLAANPQNYPSIVTDGNGGAIIGWQDVRNGTDNDIYVQSINNNAVVQWTTDGINICNAAFSQQYVVLISDGNGGAISTWQDARSGSGSDVYAQRVNSSGAIQWTANGVAISTATSSQISPTLINDGSGGAIITWEDWRNATKDIYAQRINGNGVVQWTVNGIIICNNTVDDQIVPQLVSDGNNGAVIAWQDWRNGNSDIYAELVTANGTIGGYNWTGATDNNWMNGSNWTGGFFPPSNASVFIPSGTVTNEPTLSTNRVSGYLYLGVGRTLTLSAGTSLTINTLLTNNGIITGTGLLNMNGTGTTTIVGNGYINNLLINSSGGNVTVSSGAGNMQNITGILNVSSGTLNTNGNITLKSTSITNTAMVDQVGGTINGNVTVERFIPASQRAFRFLASGVTTTTAIKSNWQEGVNNTATAYASNQNPNSGYGTHITGSTNGGNGFDATVSGNASLFTFSNDNNQIWNNINNTNSNILTSGMGYRLLVRGNRAIDLNNNTATPNNTILRATGTLTTGTVTFNTSSSIPLCGLTGAYNFIGNPYWATVDWTSLTTTNISTTYYVWDPTIAGTNGKGGYVSYTTGTGNNNVASAVNQYIQPGQAIITKTTNSTPSISFSESNKVVSRGNLAAVFGTNPTPKPRLNIQLFIEGKTNNADATALVFDNSFKKEVGNEDAVKLNNPDENIAISNNNILLGVDARPLSLFNDTIQLAVFNEFSNEYTLQLSADNFNSFNGNIIVRDTYTNTNYNIEKNGNITTIPFSITSDVTLKNQNRFIIVFAAKSITAAIADNTGKFNVSIANNPTIDNIIVNYTASQAANTTIRLINNNGQLLNNINLGMQQQGQAVIPVKQFAKGLYLVEVKMGTDTIIKKVVKE